MKKLILLAEDDKAIVDVVKIVLDQDGYSVVSAMTAHEVNEKLEKDLPDFILLDILLAGSDGGELAKSIKRNERTHNIPIVLISANNNTEKIAKESGVDGFLLKPFDIDDFLA